MVARHGQRAPIRFGVLPISSSKRLGLLNPSPAIGRENGGSIPQSKDRLEFMSNPEVDGRAWQF